MSEQREVEVWPCGYSAACSVPWCQQPATTILRYLDSHGRPYRQTDVCEIQTPSRIVAPGPARVLRRRNCESNIQSLTWLNFRQ
jgi:hypothetical protein